MAEMMQSIKDAEMDARCHRREELVRRTCKVMGWEYKTSPVFAGIRKIALGEAVAVSLNKLEEILKRLESMR